jgi:hypothetical protein
MRKKIKITNPINKKIERIRNRNISDLFQTLTKGEKVTKP